MAPHGLPIGGHRVGSLTCRSMVGSTAWLPVASGPVAILWSNGTEPLHVDCKKHRDFREFRLTRLPQTHRMRGGKKGAEVGWSDHFQDQNGRLNCREPDRCGLPSSPFVSPTAESNAALFIG